MNHNRRDRKWWHGGQGRRKIQGEKASVTERWSESCNDCKCLLDIGLRAVAKE